MGSPSRTNAYRYAGVGIQFAATLGVFGLVGYWGDAKLGTGPWLLLVGIFTGFGLGLYSMVTKLSPKKTRASDPREDA